MATATARSTAPARRAPARRAPKRATAPARKPAAPRTAPRQRRQQTPVGGFVPVAVGAVGGIADSGLVVRLTRSRLWIGMLAVLLVGIVALNVMALSFSASSSNAAREAEVFKRENSAYRAEIASLLSSEKIRGTASRLGLYNPAPDEIGYLRPSSTDAAEAAKRLRAGELSAAEYVAPVAPATVPTELAAAAAVAVEPAPSTDPAATAPVAPATDEAVAPATVAPPVAAASVSGGGVASP
jgi:cell division protein FtsB